MKELRKKEFCKYIMMIVAVMLMSVCMCLIFSQSAQAGKAKKNHWSSDGRSYYGPDKKKVKGIVVIRENKKGSSTDRLYVFNKKGKLDAGKTKEIRKLAAYEKEFSGLKKEIGNPKKSVYSDGCYSGPAVNGETPYEGGQDGILTYSGFTVSTYLAPDGTEFYLGVSAKKYKTKITKGNRSISIEKTAKKEGAEKRLIKTVGEKKYCYDKNGTQHTGWQKIGKGYYYFRIEEGRKGYMVTGKTINKIRLKKNGQAVLKKTNKSRLKTLVMATQIVEKATKPGMSKSKKLKASWNYFLKHYTYNGSPNFHYSKQWDVKYAYQIFTQKHGSCFHMGAGFAFVGNACGYKDCRAVSSGGHGWCMINGYVYDPSWCKADRGHNYYKMSLSLSGKGGRPRYKKAMKYVKRV